MKAPLIKPTSLPAYNFVIALIIVVSLFSSTRAFASVPTGTSVTSPLSVSSVTITYDPGTVAVAPPVISAVTTSGITTTGATITWTTTTLSDSYVQYSTSPSLTSPTTVGSATLATSHSVTLTGLTAGTQYYYEVQSTDASSQLTTDTNGGSYYTFTTTAATPAPAPTPTPTPVVTGGSGGAQHPLPSTPSVTTGSSTAIMGTSATLNGYVDPNTTTDTTRWFEWGISPLNLGSQTIPAAMGSVASFFSEPVTGLTPDTDYYFRAVAKNSAGTIAGFNSSFKTKPAGPQKPPPPVISNVSDSITTCRIPLSWNITGASDPNIYNATKRTMYTNAIAGSDIHFPVIHGVNIIQIRDGETVLKTLLVNCSYAF